MPYINNKKSNAQLPSITADLFKALLLTTLIVFFLAVIFYCFGKTPIFNSQITALIGALLALSGLMSKQYLLKENILYLNKWKTVEKLIDDIVLSYSARGLDTQKIKGDLSSYSNQTGNYINYVSKEIKCIPVIPLILVVLYATALVANNNIYFTALCLYFMLVLVTYLAIATITSNNLFIDTSDIDDAIKELKEIISFLEKEKATEPGA